MGRKCTPRDSFGSDIVFLTRFIESIKIDARLPEAYRRELVDKIMAVVICLQQRDSVVIELPHGE